MAPTMGLPGVAYAFLIHTAIHGMVVFYIARHLTKFAWTRDVQRLILLALSFVAASVGVGFIPDQALSTLAGVGLTLAASRQSIRGVTRRLDPEHRICRFFTRIPLVRSACGL